MLKYILFLSFFINLSLSAQETLTVVAVGEAEREQDTITIIRSSHKDLTKRQEKLLNELFDLMESDFDFYRDIFEVNKGSFSSTDGLKSKYIFENKVLKFGKEFRINFAVVELATKKQVYSEQQTINFSSIRPLGHSLTDNAFMALTGKKSIFKTKILFLSDRTSARRKLRKEIYIMDFDGFRKQRITHKNALIVSPVISPDNNQILYSVIEAKWKTYKEGTGNIQRKVQNINLYLYDLTTRKTRLISGLSGINSGGVFNKDGTGVYVTLSNLKNADIYYIDLKTLKKRRITSHFSDDVDPHMNNDETLLTFLSGRPGKAMIYTLDPRGVEKSVRRISFVGDFNAGPRFNPEGTEIVFSSWVDNRFDIYRIGSNGRNLVRLTKNFGSNEEAWYSPDGQFIVFTSQRVINSKRDVQDIYIMNRDGEIIRKITENYGKTYTPRWSN